MTEESTAVHEPRIVSDDIKAVIRPGVHFFVNNGDMYYFGKEYMVTYVTDVFVAFKDLRESTRQNNWVKFDGGSSTSWFAFEAWLEAGQLNISGETADYVHEIPYPTYNSINGIDVPGIIYTRPTYDDPEPGAAV